MFVTVCLRNRYAFIPSGRKYVAKPECDQVCKNQSKSQVMARHTFSLLCGSYVCTLNKLTVEVLMPKVYQSAPILACF